MDWESVRDVTKVILGLDSENRDALVFLASVEQVLEPESAVPPATAMTETPTQSPAQPTSFANGRYQVERFLGEGGKKKVYLAQDTLCELRHLLALERFPGHLGLERRAVLPPFFRHVPLLPHSNSCAYFRSRTLT